jgi:hypothetical protein
MGFWISLEEDGQPVTVDSHTEGGTYVLGGTSEADMSVTYNYSPFWEKALGPKPDGPHSDLYGLGPWLHERVAAKTLLMLESGAAELTDDPSGDYWEACEGNAGHVLAVLASWARQHPTARWRVHSG